MARKERKHCVVIYYHDGARQVITPTAAFEGDWAGLVHTVTHSGMIWRGGDSSKRNGYRYYEVI